MSRPRRTGKCSDRANVDFCCSEVANQPARRAGGAAIATLVKSDKPDFGCCVVALYARWMRPNIVFCFLPADFSIARGFNQHFSSCRAQLETLPGGTGGIAEFSFSLPPLQLFVLHVQQDSDDHFMAALSITSK